MATYHCPVCQKDLKKGKYPGWVTWFIGPLFGQLLRPLLCDEHGPIKDEQLAPHEKQALATKRVIGIVGGVVFNVVIIVIILAVSFK